MEVQWAKWEGDKWFTLARLNLQSVTVEGVYIIFVPDDKVIYVGQGDVSKRLENHLTDPKITKYESQSAPLRVTFTNVPAQYRDGVERFLADTFDPAEGPNHPAAMPIKVNLPCLATLWPKGSFTRFLA